MNIYNINFSELVRQLLPARLRKPRMLAMLNVLVSPIVWVYNSFLAFRTTVRYELNHNGQVCRLQGLLNDRFDDLARRIYIADSPIVLSTPVYQRLENKPLALFRRTENRPVYIRSRSELSLGGKFIIKVPSVIAFDLDEMKALVNRYKLAGKSFTIEII